MKILMFGRGVISTLYGWALDKAGNDVDFYVRPGRAVDFGQSVEIPWIRRQEEVVEGHR